MNMDNKKMFYKAIQKEIMLLKYQEELAEKLIILISTWTNNKKEEILLECKEEYYNLNDEFTNRNITIEQLVQDVNKIINNISNKIIKEIEYDMSYFELEEVIDSRKANCLGYSQVLYILINSIGISSFPIHVIELEKGLFPSTVGGIHIAIMINLPDKRVVLVDLTREPDNILSDPFFLKEQYSNGVNYCSLIDNINPLQLYYKIQIIDKNGLIANILNSRGIVNHSLGKYKQAIMNFNEAINLKNEFDFLYSNRAMSLIELGESNKALSDCSKAIQLNPESDIAYNNRGLIYDKIKKYSLAIPDYDKSIKINSRNARAYNNRGVAYSNLSKYEYAIRDYDHAINIDPSYAEAYCNKGDLLYKINQYEEVIIILTKAIELNPKYARAYWNRGVTYLILRNIELAILDLEYAKELDPKYENKYYEIMYKLQ